MAFSKKKIVNQTSVKGKDGKKAGTILSFEDGSSKTLLNPHGKGRKYAVELKSRTKMTNDGVIKKNKVGKEIRLSDTGAAYRSGYLQAQKDAAKIYKSKNK